MVFFEILEDIIKENEKYKENDIYLLKCYKIQQHSTPYWNVVMNSLFEFKEPYFVPSLVYYYYKKIALQLISTLKRFKIV